MIVTSIYLRYSGINIIIKSTSKDGLRNLLTLQIRSGEVVTIQLSADESVQLKDISTPLEETKGQLLINYHIKRVYLRLDMASQHLK